MFICCTNYKTVSGEFNMAEFFRCLSSFNLKVALSFSFEMAILLILIMSGLSQRKKYLCVSA